MKPKHYQELKAQVAERTASLGADSIEHLREHASLLGMFIRSLDVLSQDQYAEYTPDEIETQVMRAVTEVLS